MTLIKFNDEMVLRFIRAYRESSCLWDFQSPDYKNRDIRDAAYQHLVDIMDLPGFTVADVKNKIKNIRSTYCQELKKIQNCKILGKIPHVPTCIWFKEVDSFLHCNTTPRETFPNYLTMKCDPQDYLFEGSPSLEDTNSSYVENGEETEMQVYVEPSSAQLNEEHHQMNGQFPHIDYEEPRQSKKRKREDDFANKMIEATKHLSSISNSFKQNDDEFDVFGKSVAAQLKQFSLCHALSVQSKIQLLLSEERIKEITTNESKVKVNHSPTKQHRRPSSRNSQLSLQVSCDSETSDLDA